MKITNLILILLLLILPVSGVNAETIKLKSGKVIEGEIVQETPNSILINYLGQKIAFYKDYIKEIVRDTDEALLLSDNSSGEDSSNQETEIIQRFNENEMVFIYYVDGQEVARKDPVNERIVGHLPDGVIRHDIKEDGSLILEQRVKNNQIVPSSDRVYDSEGNIPEGLRLIDGRLEGELSEYYENGNLKSKLFYEHGLKVKVETYRETGELVMRFINDYDARENQMLWFYPNGTLRTESKMDFDNPGVFKSNKMYDKNGNLIN